MRKWLVYLIGLLIMTLGLVLVIVANLGSAPWDVLHIGLYKQFGLTIGSWSIIVGVFVLGSSAILSKAIPKIGAFLNMLLCGIFIDMYMLIPWLDTPETMLGQFIMLLIGIILNAYGMAIYISANVGTGPRDSLMLALMQRTGIKVQWVRLIMEVTVLAVGWMLGGPVGIGTVILSLLIGHIAGFALPQCQKMTDYWLKKRPVEVIEDRVPNNSL
ncbi:YitT family protein [Schinkia azotoformans]|uniref:YitT family protein n=1 Tax=Schinkia azotoformans LMG 9581 TaxID=1131731 RepID=K6C180_SCHAZ|nr:YitT family protein [Schinkia azotoformans]EKN64920.1 hypothetical protein BAZO_11989 [Schinkia azotoformans LMG 9581]MEC1640304.1 YitT family protein [Schinkia azotoformans]MEC1945653.1 YitT family protein [Schinkia azotoformans]